MVTEYIDKILQWPLPTTGKELQSFLGFCGYYQRSIREYGKLTAGLQELKMQTGPLIWTPQLRADFKDLKLCFKDKPVRAFPRYDLDDPFLLDCDFSARNMAAVLSQKQEGEERLIGVVAKKCSKAEAAYSSFKGELGAIILGLRKFEHLLRCKKFLIRTDSKSIVTLKKMPDPRGIFIRWLSFLDSFSYDLEHRPGKQSQNADSLSRMPGLKHQGPENQDPYDQLHDLVDEVYAIDRPSRYEITDNSYREGLAEDDILQQVIDLVKSGETPTKEAFKAMSPRLRSYARLQPLLEVDEKNQLYLHTSPPPWERTSEDHREIRLCPPVSLFSTIFFHCHTGRLAGHCGRDETHRAISARFFWPGMWSYTSIMTANCPECLRKLTQVDKIQHEMYTYPLGRFNQKLYVDLVGPFNAATYQGTTMFHLVTMLDGYTRYLVCQPVPSQTAEVVGKAILESWFFRFGIPENIHSDNGRNFISEVWKECLDQLGVEQSLTPPYTPQSNRVERAHRSLLASIRADIHSAAHLWPQKVAVATFLHNARVNRLTGISPFFMLHGFHPRMPIDHLFPELKGEKDDSITRIFVGFDAMWKYVTEKRGEYELVLKANRGIPDLEMGDVVYYFLHGSRSQKQMRHEGTRSGTSSKLLPKYVGPYEITRKLTNQLYVITPVGTWCHNSKPVVCLANRIRKLDENKVIRDTITPHLRTETDLLEEDLLMSPSEWTPSNSQSQENDQGLQQTEDEIDAEVLQIREY